MTSHPLRPHPLLLAILAVLPGCSETFDTEGCISIDEDTKTCPAPSKVPLDDVFLTEVCGDDIELVKLKSDGKRRESAGVTIGPVCCYTVEVVDHNPGADCVIGRPFFEGERTKVAPIALAAAPIDAPSSSIAGSDARAAAWARAGAAEHASVAAFSRLSLQLLRLGAPLELLEGVQTAALEEVQHAKACWNLAEQLCGQAIQVGEFPFGSAVDVNTTLADLAYAAVREGCLAETLGACVVQAVAPLAADDARTALGRLGDDEARHAVLSFRIVSWALQVGGPDVERAVRSALAEPWPTLDTAELAVRAGVSQPTIARAEQMARRQVLEPATRALVSSQADAQGTGSISV